RLADWIAMRTTDTFLAFPELIAAVVIAGVLGAGTGTLVLAPLRRDQAHACANEQAQQRNDKGQSQ
ncbi:MAG: hypothetical protein AAFY39_11815, partial [Pseudomonadota bacterium]